MMPEPTDGDFHAYYAAAHHDVWWAKTQQWAAVGWAFALLGGIVGLAKVFDLPPSPTKAACTLVVLQVAVVVAVIGYLARLHYDTIRARRITAKLRELRPELGVIASQLPGHAESSPDDVRGAIFPNLLVTAVVVAQTVATFAVLRSDGWSAGLAIGGLVLGFFLIGYARRKAMANGGGPNMAGEQRK